MSDPDHTHAQLPPSAGESLVNVLKAAAHSASCSAGLLLAGDFRGWQKMASFGPAHDFANEAWLRLVTSYDDIVLLGKDTPAGIPFTTSGSQRTLICVTIRGQNRALQGAFLLSAETPQGLSTAQRYALRTHAAHLSAYLEPGGQRNGCKYGSDNPERLRLLESVVINAKDAILITEAEPIDLPGPRIVYCNPAFLETTGFTEEEVIGRTPRILQCNQTNRESLDIIRKALSKWQPIEIELANTRKDGSLFWVELSIVPVANEKGWFTHWVSVQRDITERKEAQKLAEHARQESEEKAALQNRLEEREQFAEKLFYIAFHDELTTLHNRAYLMSKLEAAFNAPRSVALEYATILFLDLDGFKVVNDCMGHLAGDQLLTQVARRLKSCMRPDNILARMGGDEFAILVLGENQASTAVHLAQEIIAQLRAPLSLEEQEIFLSCSIGIVTANETHLKPENLLRDADVAMYAAKKQGRGRWSIFNSAMRKAAIDALAIQNALRQSVKNEDFMVFYQPIYFGPTGRLTGVEALVRWAHPQLGVIAPDSFIPIAEDLGIIHEIGAWVMRKACTDVQAWRAEVPSLELRLNVNVSGKELNRPGYIEQITKIIRETELPASLLQIEVTESVFLHQPEAVTVVLEAVRQLGVRVALDDFGIGYSSLGYIDRYPIDAVKIDRSFVSRMMLYERSDAIVRSILSLGRTLNLDITAEGIETAEQYQRLRDMRCPYFQGYFFNPPVRPEEIKKIIKKSHQQPDS